MRTPSDFPILRFRVLTEQQWQAICRQTGHPDPDDQLVTAKEVYRYAAGIRAQAQADWIAEHFWLLDWQAQPTGDLHCAHWYDKQDYPTLQRAQDALELERRRLNDPRARSRQHPRRKRSPA
jgi:hypothetical protein